MAARHVYLARHGAADAFGELTAARETSRSLPGVPVAGATELIDHVPYVPARAEMPAAWAGFFDGYDDDEAAAGRRTADALVARCATAPDPAAPGRDTHEVLVTHAYAIAWLVGHALDRVPRTRAALRPGARTAPCDFRTRSPPPAAPCSATPRSWPTGPRATRRREGRPGCPAARRPGATVADRHGAVRRGRRRGCGRR